MQVIDTFPFNKDFMTLEIRLNELWDTVDKFIIVESKYSHTGEVKPLYLKEYIHLFDKYKEKIILIWANNLLKKLWLLLLEKKSEFLSKIPHEGIEFINSILFLSYIYFMLKYIPGT